MRAAGGRPGDLSGGSRGRRGGPGQEGWGADRAKFSALQPSFIQGLLSIQRKPRKALGRRFQKNDVCLHFRATTAATLWD